MALQRKWIPSPNYSSRGGTKVRLVVIHTAEGATTIESLGSFFSNPSSQVSSQTGIDDKLGICGEYVKRENKPWTQGNANPYSTATELCAFAKWDRAEWLRHPNMLENTKQWINEECAAFGIPKVRLNASQAQGGQAGVCGHVDLGSAGGGHWDPGPNFPWDIVLGGAPAPPTTAPPTTPPPSGGAAPPFPGRVLSLTNPMMNGQDVRTWQQQMKNRGWAIGVDGYYGNESKTVCTNFQREKSLSVDGQVGPQTWAASWNAPVT
jgi:N-acetyl-anhydromuramyl-L-alanine amidase AmpD